MDASATGRVANIGPRERRKRLSAGVVAFVISVAAGAALIAGRLAAPWRLALFLPFFVAALGYFQARDKT